MKKIKLNLIQLLLIVGIPTLFLSIVSGSLVYSNLKGNNNKYIQEFIETYNKLRKEYYEDLDENKLIDAAISGMFQYTGDDYTIYMDEDATDALNEKLEGTYEGIGITITLNDEGKIVIYKVLEDSPSENAGLKKDDIIISINGEFVDGKTSNEVSKMIKDSKDSKFEIGILRDGKELSFEVERKKLIVPAISSSIKEVDNKKIGYIFIETFSNTIDTQFESTLLSMEKDGIDSLIIDVRGNTGGYLRACTNIIELFLKKGDLMYSVKSKKEYPIVVLVNGGSASASEILASSLKYSYGATIVGTKTYGKGKVQSTDTLDDGTMVKYTTARWYMPNGKCLDEKGLNPDVEIELDKDYFVEQSEEYDNQLNKSIEILSE